MNPLMCWIIVYLMRENLNRIILAIENLTTSINRVEKRLTTMQKDLTSLRGLDQMEDMEIDD